MTLESQYVGSFTAQGSCLFLAAEVLKPRYSHVLQNRRAITTEEGSALVKSAVFPSMEVPNKTPPNR